MGEFVDEVTVLSRWLGRDVAADLRGGLPFWSAFRFRDATVFAPDSSESADRMYLVRGGRVGEFTLSLGTIDEAYARLDAETVQPAGGA